MRATAPVASSMWSCSGAAARGLSGTKTAPASQMPAMVQMASGPLGSRAATAWPGTTPARCRVEATSVVAVRALPAVVVPSMVKRRPSGSGNGWSMRTPARFTSPWLSSSIPSILYNFNGSVGPAGVADEIGRHPGLTPIAAAAFGLGGRAAGLATVGASGRVAGHRVALGGLQVAPSQGHRRGLVAGFDGVDELLVGPQGGPADVHGRLE